MKGNSVRAVDMVRRIRDRQVKGLAGKSTAEAKAGCQGIADELRSTQSQGATFTRGARLGEIARCYAATTRPVPALRRGVTP